MANFTPQQIEQFLQEYFDVVGARQYIGARYVPIFGRRGEDTIEWDDLAPYEPLTVVIHQGTSYVSRQYVPAGVAVTDTSYWVATYRFDGQVEMLRRNIVALADKLPSNEFSDVTVKAYIDAINDTLTDDLVPFPTGSNPKYGTAGQVLATDGDGHTVWQDRGLPTDEQTQNAVDNWLDAHPEATTTIEDDSITDAKLVQTGGILERLDRVANVEWDTVGYPTTDGTYINCETGAVANAANYYCLTGGRLPIPNGATRIEFPSVQTIEAGVAGWATYTTDSGPATSAYLRGGKTQVIDVGPNDRFFGVSGVKEGGVLPSSVEVTFTYGKINQEIRQQHDELAAIVDDVDDAVDAIEGVAGDVTMLKEVCMTDGERSDMLTTTLSVYCDKNTGLINNVNAHYCCTGRVQIPTGCSKIVFPDVKMVLSGTAGWATYSSGGGSSTGAFVRGGDNLCIDVTDADKWFAVTDWRAEVQSQAWPIEVIYVFGEVNRRIYDTAYPLNEKRLAFCGDSITYGYDDSASGAQLANPWPKQVGDILRCLSDNYGVSSASLMDGTIPGSGNPTPRAWVTWYTNLPQGYDILGVLIGINDAYRHYTLGTFADRTADTFYGALHVFWKGMQQRFPASAGKHVFMIDYPQYDVTLSPVPFSDYREAMNEVCEYYSVPILHLDRDLGISPYNDPNGTYWMLTGSTHSPHPTQAGANVYASVVAEFVKRMFG